MMEFSPELYERFRIAMMNRSVMAKEIVLLIENGLDIEKLDGVWDLDPRSLEKNPQAPRIRRIRDDLEEEFYEPLEFYSLIRRYRNITESKYPESALFVGLFSYSVPMQYAVVKDLDTLRVVFDPRNRATWNGATFWGSTGYDPDEYANNYAHFYAECAKDCRILVATTKSGEIAGYAPIWDNARIVGSTCPTTTSFVDTIFAASYGAKWFVRTAAWEVGAEVISDGGDQFTDLETCMPWKKAKVISDATCNIKVHGHIQIPKDYRYGIPYDSGFKCISPDPENEGEYVISSRLDDDYIGIFTFNHNIRFDLTTCPQCGKNASGVTKCYSCGFNIPIKHTPVGEVVDCPLVHTDEYGDVPAIMTDENGKVFPVAEHYLKLWNLADYHMVSLPKDTFNKDNKNE